MRIRLLSDAGYDGMCGVTFPVDVEARRHGIGGVDVHSQELARIGADMAYFDDDDYWWCFTSESWEVV